MFINPEPRTSERMSEIKQEGITAKKAQDFDEWYTQAILKSELADYSPVSGCLVYRPSGYALWEKIREAADIEFKPTDALTLDLSGFSSKLTASNFNRNYLLWPTHFLASGAGQAPLPGYTISQNTLTSATFAPVVQSRITARRCNATSSASLEATMQHRDAFSPRPTLPRS